MRLGTQAFPLRVAIVGAGPSGFYATEHLQKQTGLFIQIDMYDRLPTPFGLVRGGVAPDHARIKLVTNVYDRIASHPEFRFYGNVHIGQDISHADLTDHYHFVIYTTGAQTDRGLDIPGINLKNSHAATEFVGWYNGHPDYRDLTFDLSVERVAVIGIGNVAVDVARILAKSYDELVTTDIADYALEALRHSRVKEIYVLGRRGPAQAAFTNPEIKEFGELQETDVIVLPEEIALDPLSQAYLETSPDRRIRRNVEILSDYANRKAGANRKKVTFRFFASPVELLGTERVEGMRIVKNELYESENGELRSRATDHIETLDVGLVFRSIGYQGVPLPGVPFLKNRGIIPNDRGRVIDPKTQEPLPGVYTAGWIKRGPSGVIGTNKPDSQETIDRLLEDLSEEKVLRPASPSREALEAFLRVHKPDYVTYADWRILDHLEQERGEAVGRPRLKFTRVPEMLDALTAHKARA